MEVSSKLSRLPKRLQGQKDIIWYEYVRLAREYNTVDLGVGFPDFLPPKHILDALQDITSYRQENVLKHQYTRGLGHPRLVQVLSKLYSKLTGIQVDPLENILVTIGAYEALFASISGHVDVGDEVIIIEPSFDSYVPVIQLAGGIPKYVPLKFYAEDGPRTSANFRFDLEELKSAFSSKTKAIILNTPQNPTGKVFSRQELQEIADLCKKWDVLCISDEVYEWLVFEPDEHIRIASLPGMWERTITIGSAGKGFNLTGWKIGWAYGPANLIYNLRLIHQNSIYTCSTTLQEAVAVGFEIELERLDSKDSYFGMIRKEMMEKRDYLIKILSKVGFKPIISQGSYFLIADWLQLEPYVNLKDENNKEKDVCFSKWLTKNVGVQCIPTTVFYCEKNKHLSENLVRFCFTKNKEKLDSAYQILANWRGLIPNSSQQ